eukprot:6213133-Pleurochrysis_carterae.AAC.5
MPSKSTIHTVSHENLGPLRWARNWNIQAYPVLACSWGPGRWLGSARGGAGRGAGVARRMRVVLIVTRSGAAGAAAASAATASRSELSEARAQQEARTDAGEGARRFTVAYAGLTALSTPRPFSHAKKARKYTSFATCAAAALMAAGASAAFDAAPYEQALAQVDPSASPRVQLTWPRGRAVGAPQSLAVLDSSFNPPTSAHLHLLQEASQRFG